MRVRAQSEREPRLLAGLVLLAAGVAIGWLLRAPRTAPGVSSAHGSEPPEVPWRRPSGPLPANDLATLEFELPESTRRSLSAERELALQREMILTEDAELLPARVRLAIGGEPGPWLEAGVRLKGDLLDHLDSERWSLRVELASGRLLGMSRFSIQHPKTRDHLLGWLALALARREGLLAPRARFVNVVLDGTPNGIYQLEEHFSKELLESQGRREGPIVRFTEDAFWRGNLELRGAQRRGGDGASAGNPAFVAEVAGYGEGRLARDERLAASLQRGLDQLRELQLQMIADSTRDLFAVPEIESAFPAGRQEEIAAARAEELAGLRAPALARMQALARARSQGVAELVDVERCARMGALLSTLNARHGATWHNLRFYHDPVSDRLEPVLFDLGPSLSRPGVPEPLVWETSLVAGTLRANDDYYLETFRHLRRFASPEWLAQAEEELGSELARYGAALAAAGDLLPGGDPASIWNGLRVNQAGLRRILEPGDPLGFHARLYLEPTEGGVQRGALAIEVWSRSRVPAVLEGFRYSNGELVAARAALAAESEGAARIEGDAVVLPWDGRRLRFRFPVDERLASLREVEAVVAAIRGRTPRDRSVELQLDAVYRRYGAEETASEPLALRRSSVDGWLERGRPPAPTLEEALRRHPFLDYDLDAARLVVRPGEWRVEGDLLLPEGHHLHVGPGVTLRFEAGAVLCSADAIQMSGSANEPIVLAPLEPDAPWSGVLVIDAREKSVWSHVELRGAGELARGGWASTGGLTFYRSAVELRDCRFVDARGEDALNVFGAPFLLDRCRFEGASSDAFDGDFVSGIVRECEFRDAAGDGVDLSGSRVRVERCRFTDVADKAISAGEASEVELSYCLATRCGIGLAVKDASQVSGSEYRVVEPRVCALAAYVKKAEYGPSRVELEGLRVEGEGLQAFLVQAGCEVTVDGRAIEGEELDVERLYAEGVLGN